MTNIFDKFCPIFQLPYQQNFHIIEGMQPNYFRGSFPYPSQAGGFLPSILSRFVIMTSGGKL